MTGKLLTLSILDCVAFPEILLVFLKYLNPSGIQIFYRGDEIEVQIWDGALAG